MCIYHQLICLHSKHLALVVKAILFKKPVTTEYGFTIVDNIVVSHDWIDVSKQLLKTLEFRLSDAYGRTIDLRGMPISVSLIFMLQYD